jgi:hypothetical protein
MRKPVKVLTIIYNYYILYHYITLYSLLFIYQVNSYTDNYRKSTVYIIIHYITEKEKHKEKANSGKFTIHSLYNKKGLSVKRTR